jgi:hypothetical protein
VRDGRSPGRGRPARPDSRPLRKLTATGLGGTEPLVPPLERAGKHVSVRLVAHLEAEALEAARQHLWDDATKFRHDLAQHCRPSLKCLHRVARQQFLRCLDSPAPFGIAALPEFAEQPDLRD